MLNLCIFVFIFYALFAIVRMLIDYTVGEVTNSSKRRRSRQPYGQDSVGIGVTKTT